MESRIVTRLQKGRCKINNETDRNHILAVSIDCTGSYSDCHSSMRAEESSLQTNNCAGENQEWTLLVLRVHHHFFHASPGQLSGSDKF